MRLKGCNNNNNPQNLGSAFPCEKIKTATAVLFFVRSLSDLIDLACQQRKQQLEKCVYFGEYCQLIQTR